MKFTVLGCSGGIGGAGSRTTSFLVDDDVLIDAGTGVGELPLARLARIDHVFITHAHLDHIACLPLLVDSVGDLRPTPVTVYATDATLAVLRAHIFNWAVWPDFTRIPSPESAFMRFCPVVVGEPVELPGGRSITPLPAYHTVPAVGYHLAGTGGSLVFSGDTTSHPPFWQAVNSIPDLTHLIVETAFGDEEIALARASRHLCPSLLGEELARLNKQPQLWITHLKPGQFELIMEQVGRLAAAYSPRLLTHGQVLEF